MTDTKDRLSNRTKYLMLAGVTVALVLVMFATAEVAIRVRQTLKYGTDRTPDDLYRVDSRIGLRVPTPSMRVGRIETNSLGFRGPEIAVPKPAGTIRLAFLGASTTWCAEVSGNEKVWPHIVAESLRQGFPRARIDYVNAGVPGYAVDSSLKNLRHRVAPLRPDVVVIYHATNDMSGDLREAAAAKGVVQDAKVIPESWPAMYSLLWGLAEKNWRVWISQRQAERNVGRLEVDPKELGERFRLNLTELVVSAQSAAKLVALATFATQLRRGQTDEQKLRASASALYYMPFMHPDGLIASYERYNEIIRDVAKATGALLIEGEHDIPGDPDHFTDTVHFTDRGSEKMAARVSSALSQSPEVASMLRSSAADPR